MQIELTEREIDHIRMAVSDAIVGLRQSAASDFATPSVSLCAFDASLRFDAILSKLNLAVGGSMTYAGRDPQQASPEVTEA
jgi:hypothetical protein